MKRKCKIMALGKYTEEQSKKMSMIELANLILGEQKKELNFKELFDQVAETKQLTDAQRKDLLARFYTDLNIDGRFMALGSNVWGLKRWYPADQTTEKSLAASRKRNQEEEELEEDEFLDEEEDEDFDETDDGLIEIDEQGFDKIIDE